MAKFRKIPVEIDAEQFDGINLLNGMSYDMGGAYVRTIHNNQICYVVAGDWIIPEGDGIHFYPCKNDVFIKTYEPI